MRKRLLLSLLILVMLLFIPVYQYLSIESYDIIIYGGGMPGCAAARSAAWAAPEKKILLIVPEPVAELGGLATVGGQNFADIRYWQGQLVTEGSFKRWFEETGQFYHTAQLAEIIKKDLAQFSNLTVLFQHDVQKMKKRGNTIKTLSLAPVYRDEEGQIQWAEGQIRVRGTVFIDASDDGRLTRFSGENLSVGRQDWPLEYLPAEETTGKWARQQAATMMFKVTGIKKPEVPSTVGDLNFVIDHKGSWGLVGGKETWRNDPVITNFNKKYGSKGFALKPLNAAQDGAGSNEWWVNMLLVYDVDGRAHEKDRGTTSFPEMGTGQRTTDQAWREARELLQQPEFLEALQRFKAVDKEGQMYGLGEVCLVWDDQHKPVVGKIMYLRETVHISQSKKNDQSSSDEEIPVWHENSDFALTTREVQKAGGGFQDGEDGDNYFERIGLGYYMMDINAFMIQDLQQEDGYVWPVTNFLRPDWQKEGGQPTNPVYLPYSMLKSPENNNLLVPGCATSCSSLAWAEIRVLPNLTVLGDAAGVAAARAVLFGEKPVDFTLEQLQWVQEKLRLMGARLEK
jgi:hypothetical protein